VETFMCAHFYQGVSLTSSAATFSATDNAVTVALGGRGKYHVRLTQGRVTVAETDVELTGTHRCVSQTTH